MKKIPRRPNVIYFLIIGALISGIFYLLKNGNAIDDLLSSRESEYKGPLPGFEAKKTPTATESLKPTPASTLRDNPSPVTKNDVLLDVPFTPQAPFGNWDDPRQQAGCEEATALMAMRWVSGQSLTFQEAEKEIIAISDFELKNYGHFHDSSVQDMVVRIFKGYFQYDNIEIKYDITADDIRSELTKNNLVIVPANGQKLNNPYYNPPGPLEHALVIRGYDSKTKEFITNDSGTKRGELFRYSEQVVMDAIYDYPTGYHEPILEIRKAMIIVKKPVY